MEYTLENTIKATHYVYYATIEENQFFDNSLDNNLKFMNEGHIKWIPAGYSLGEIKGNIIELSRPHNETKEYYAQPITIPRAHAAMAAEFMSDDRIKCEMVCTNGDGVLNASPTWDSVIKYRLIHPKTQEEALRDELIECIGSTPMSSIFDSDSKIADYLLSKFNITRK